MHFKLSTKQCPSSDDEKEDMKKVPYASAVGSLMMRWFVQDQILLTLLELLAVFFLIREENIGML